MSAENVRKALNAETTKAICAEMWDRIDNLTTAFAHVASYPTKPRSRKARKPFKNTYSLQRKLKRQANAAA